jgi:cytoskeletal protein RodZ
MQTLKRTFVVLSAVGLLSIPAYVAAQDPPAQPPSTPQAEPQAQPQPQPLAPMPEARESAKSKTAKGELVSVDDVAKSITIKDETGAELKFAYDDKTDVSGAKEGVAGLATRAGSKVTVKYTDGATKTATKIEVQRQSSQP